MEHKELLTLAGRLNLPEAVLAPLAAAAPVLSVHIPSDAVLDREELAGSYDMALRFFSQEKLCPWGRPRAMVCGSWLLAPALDGLRLKTPASAALPGTIASTMWTRRIRSSMSGWVQALGRTAGAYQPPAGSKGSLGHRGSFGYGKGCPDQQGNYGKSRSYGGTNIRNKKLLLYLIGTEVLLILCIALANLNPAPVLYFIFYNFLYGLVFSLLVLLYCLQREKESLASVGVKRLGPRQFAVLFAFVIFSVGGHLIPKMAAGEQIPWHLLPLGIVPLIMTTFFEEFLFRGFVQSRAEQQFGCLPAILISGAMFSLYHLGYPGFRAWEDLRLLFAVGLGFAAAYRLSGNNLIVSYFVNLPNAFATYILKYEQFPVMSVSFTIAAAITLVLIGFIILMFRNTNRTKRRQSIMELIKLTHDNIDQEHICCAISNNKDVKVISQKAWLKERLDEGLVFLKGNVRGKCFIEYIPAEYAWTPVEAEGYMVIDCLWVSGQFKGHGYSNLLLDACIEDSKAKGKQGLVSLSSKKKLGFLSDPGYMRHKGFVTADTVEPYFELLYLAL